MERETGEQGSVEFACQAVARVARKRSARHVLDYAEAGRAAIVDRRSEERRVGKSVDLGGRRIIKKKKHNEGSWRVGETMGDGSWEHDTQSGPTGTHVKSPM